MSEVLLDRERREDAATFRHQRDAVGDSPVGGIAGERLAVVPDVAAHRLNEPDDRLQQRRLAGSVGADDRHRLGLGDVQVDAEQRLEVAVADIEAVDVEQTHTSLPGSRSRRVSHSMSSPRYTDAHLVRRHDAARVALDQLATEVHRDHPIDDTQQGVDDVFDPHDRDACRPGSA